jgi:ABC-type nitrate/sulfonate/bicarbonate transport system substrate-binding protein
MRRDRAILTAGAALGTLLAGGRAMAADAPVRIAALTIDASAACYYAQEQGFFKDAGIVADIQGITSGGAIVAAVSSNAVDVGFANLVSAVAAFSRNLPVTLVAPGSVDVEWARANPAVVAAFDDASVKANAWGNAHHDLSAQILAKHERLDPEVLVKMNRAIYTTRLVPAELQPAIDVAARYGAIPQSMPVEKMLFK